MDDPAWPASPSLRRMMYWGETPGSDLLEVAQRYSPRAREDAALLLACSVEQEPEGRETHLGDRAMQLTSIQHLERVLAVDAEVARHRVCPGLDAGVRVHHDVPVEQ